MFAFIRRALEALGLRAQSEFDAGRHYARQAINVGRGAAAAHEVRSALEHDDFIRGMAHELHAAGAMSSREELLS